MSTNFLTSISAGFSLYVVLYFIGMAARSVFTVFLDMRKDV